MAVRLRIHSSGIGRKFLALAANCECHRHEHCTAGVCCRHRSRPKEDDSARHRRSWIPCGARSAYSREHRSSLPPVTHSGTSASGIGVVAPAGSNAQPAVRESQRPGRHAHSSLPASDGTPCAHSRSHRIRVGLRYALMKESFS